MMREGGLSPLSAAGLESIRTPYTLLDSVPRLRAELVGSPMVGVQHWRCADGGWEPGEPVSMAGLSSSFPAFFCISICICIWSCCGFTSSYHQASYAQNTPHFDHRSSDCRTWNHLPQLPFIGSLRKHVSSRMDLRSTTRLLLSRR